MATCEEQNCQSEGKKNKTQREISLRRSTVTGHNNPSVLPHFRVQYHNGHRAVEHPKVRSLTTGCAGLLALLRLPLCEGEAVQRVYPQTTISQPFIILLGKQIYVLLSDMSFIKTCTAAEIPSNFLAQLWL